MFSIWQNKEPAVKPGKTERNLWTVLSWRVESVKASDLVNPLQNRAQQLCTVTHLSVYVTFLHSSIFRIFRNFFGLVWNHACPNWTVSHRSCPQQGITSRICQMATMTQQRTSNRSLTCNCTRNANIDRCGVEEHSLLSWRHSRCTPLVRTPFRFVWTEVLEAFCRNQNKTSYHFISRFSLFDQTMPHGSLGFFTGFPVFFQFIRVDISTKQTLLIASLE